MRRWLVAGSVGLVVLVAGSGCSRVDASKAQGRLDASRVAVRRQTMQLAQDLAVRLGGTPHVTTVRYDLCGTAPADALLVHVTAQLRPDVHAGTARLRAVAQDAGATVEITQAAQGLIPAVVWVKYHGHELAIAMKDGIIRVGMDGTCIDVTDEQANDLLEPR